MTMKFLSYNDNEVFVAYIKSVRAMARAKITSYFLHEIIFLRLTQGVKKWFGVVKSMDNLLNFCHFIMMKRENPFHIDKIIRFLHHETRARALVRAKSR